MAETGQRKYKMFQQALWAYITASVVIAGILALAKAPEQIAPVIKVFGWVVVGILGAGVGANAVKPFFENTNINIGRKKDEIE